MNMAVGCLICIFILPVCFSASLPDDGIVMKMETFIDLIQKMESGLPEWSVMDLSKLLLSLINEPTKSNQHFSDKQAALARVLIPHNVVELEEIGWQEHGVVLAPDGTTVALGSLLTTMVVGWKVDCDEKTVESDEKESKNPGPSQEQRIKGMGQITLPSVLALQFASHKDSSHVALDFPDGCWDSISNPKTFRLNVAPSRNDLTLAMVNGVLDGALLSKTIEANINNDPQKMSGLLESYYGGIPAKSPYRRQHFQALLRKDELKDEIVKAIGCNRKQSKDSDVPHMTDKELKEIADAAANQFEQSYLDCPAIVPRCMWGAKPYKGTPTLLRLPLKHVYIHHTYEPSRPCLSFNDCSADMRSMQRFHQEDRGWDDIGYSFVGGSDGYLYEGRGWFWVGAHTKGHNSIGYGVSFIGDFTASAPEDAILGLVRDRFLKCAVKSGYIISDYTIQGHRQVVNTSCPGDALFQKITAWKNFKES